MAIRSFSEHLRAANSLKETIDQDGAVYRHLQLVDDNFRVDIKINLSKHEQHEAAIAFLRQVATEIESLARITFRQWKNYD